MSRSPVVPAQLKAGPFTLAEAARAGLTREHLRSSAWRRVSRGFYVWAGKKEADEVALHAAARRLPAGSVFAGRTAGWLHGLDFSPCNPIEVIVPPDVGVSGRTGLRIRRAAVDQRDIVKAGRWPATSMSRTLLDLAQMLDRVETVVAFDAALHLDAVSLGELRRALDRYAGIPGVARFREALELASTGSESPMETRLRLLILDEGLPRPETQAVICDVAGIFAARIDLYYPDARLGIEYDGGVHRDKLVEDNRRQNKLMNAGIQLLRYTADDVYNHRDRIAGEIRALRKARLPASRS